MSAYRENASAEQPTKPKARTWKVLPFASIVQNAECSKCGGAQISSGNICSERRWLWVFAKRCPSTTEAALP